VSRPGRIAVAVGALLLGLALSWSFLEYRGPSASAFLAASPFPCPFHPWR
jgi:hypothetical protein